MLLEKCSRRQREHPLLLSSYTSFFSWCHKVHVLVSSTQLLSPCWYECKSSVQEIQLPLKFKLRVVQPRVVRFSASQPAAITLSAIIIPQSLFWQSQPSLSTFQSLPFALLFCFMIQFMAARKVRRLQGARSRKTLCSLKASRPTVWKAVWHHTIIPKTDSLKVLTTNMG